MIVWQPSEAIREGVSLTGMSTSKSYSASFRLGMKPSPALTL